MLPGNSIQGSQLEPERRGSLSPFPEKSAVARARNHLRLPHPLPCTLTLGLLFSKTGTDLTVAACSSFWAWAHADLVFTTGDQLPLMAGNRSKVAAAAPFQAAGI